LAQVEDQIARLIALLKGDPFDLDTFVLLLRKFGKNVLEIASNIDDTSSRVVVSSAKDLFVQGNQLKLASPEMIAQHKQQMLNFLASFLESFKQMNSTT